MQVRVENHQFDRLTALQNKKPKWDGSHGGHVLNFQGRVNAASVKNFQLCVENEDEVILQFGRVGKDRFSMDCKFPLSPFEAFAICVACMDNKLADRKGYEFFKKLTTVDVDTTPSEEKNNEDYYSTTPANVSTLSTSRN